MLSEEIGRLQSFADGEKIFQDFMDMRNRPKFLNNLKAHLKNIPDAHRYYTEDELIFVFKKGILETLIKRLKNDNDIIVLYPGMRDDGRKGRPTLIACPYQKASDESDIYAFAKPTDGSNNDLGEHNGLVAVKMSESFKIPLTIPAPDIDPNFKVTLT